MRSADARSARLSRQRHRERHRGRGAEVSHLTPLAVHSPHQPHAHLRSTSSSSSSLLTICVVVQQVIHGDWLAGRMNEAQPAEGWAACFDRLRILAGQTHDFHSFIRRSSTHHSPTPLHSTAITRIHCSHSIAPSLRHPAAAASPPPPIRPRSTTAIGSNRFSLFPSR